MPNEILDNLLAAIKSGDEDDIAMAVKLAEFATNGPAPTTAPLIGGWVCIDHDSDLVYGFPDEQQAESFENALHAQGIAASRWEIRDPASASSNTPAQPIPGASPQAINFNPATGKYDLDPNTSPTSKLRSGEGGIYK